MTENEWTIYNGAETNGIERPENQDFMITEIDMNAEIAASDRRFVEKHFAGMTIAGDPIEYSFNRYGQLTVTVKGYKVKGGIRQGIYQGIANSRQYFKATEEMNISGQWTLLRGIMFPDGSAVEAGILYRGNSIIGIYKAGTDVGRTIAWFEKNVYKTNLWKNMRVSSIREFRPEVENDVYRDMPAEFTRVDELEEIRSFITSLKYRRLSWEEGEILADIESEISNMLA